MIRREKYLKTASRRRSIAVKRDQKINADKEALLREEAAKIRRMLGMETAPAYAGASYAQLAA